MRHPAFEKKLEFFRMNWLILLNAHGFFKEFSHFFETFVFRKFKILKNEGKTSRSVFFLNLFLIVDTVIEAACDLTALHL